MPSASAQERYYEKQVDDVVARYRHISRPSQILMDIFEKPDASSLLVDSVKRQISLVKCRSLAMEAGQVTIYDRALLILARFGLSLDNFAALELYLTEYLGIVPISSVAQNEHIIANHLGLQDKIIKGLTIRHDIDDKYEHHRHHNGHRSRNNRDRSREKPEDRQDIQRRVDRILDVYYEAKDSYFYAIEHGGMVNLETARFLRDSAENALRYLRANGLSDHSEVSELEEIFNLTRDKTAELLGGKKRHFDEGNEGRRSKRRRHRRNVDSYRPNPNS